MSNVRHASTLLFLLALLVTGPGAAFAQEGRPTLYVRLDYMAVEPAKIAQYVQLEQQVWKPIHETLIEEGISSGWNLYAVRFPGGTENGYNYVTANLYDDLEDLEAPFPEDILGRVHPGMDATKVMSDADAARELIRSELWVLIDQVGGSADAPSSPSRFVIIDYKDVAPGEEEAYVAGELDVWKPVHEARREAGKIDSWAVYRMLLPAGTDVPYNFGTANFFNSLTVLDDFYPIDLIRNAMADVWDLPGANPVGGGFRTELWELIDYAE